MCPVCVDARGHATRVMFVERVTTISYVCGSCGIAWLATRNDPDVAFRPASPEPAAATTSPVATLAGAGPAKT